MAGNFDKSWTSWNGTISHHYESLHEPETEDALADIVAHATTVRVVGQGYSSSDICGGTTTLISLSRYRRIIRLDPSERTVTAQTGIILKDLIEACAREGLGFQALPDIDTVTLGGALATGTHGTGRHARPLSEYMRSCRLIVADGSVQVLERGQEEFEALKVSLGTLGIMSEVSLDLVPLADLFLVEQPLADTEWMSHFPAWLERHEFVRVLWLPHTGMGYTILGDHSWTPGLAEFAGRTQFQSLDVPPHYKHRRKVSAWLYKFAIRWPALTVLVNRLLARFFFSATKIHKGSLYDATVTKSRSGTLELAEWTIDLADFHACFRDLEQALGRKGKAAWSHIPMDIRFIRGDRTWIGNASGRDTVTVGCVSRHAPSADRHKAFTVVEEIFLRHGGRPHWAKRFACGSPTLARLYPRWKDFVDLRARMDPKGKFLNGWLRGIFTTPEASADQASPGP